MFSSRNSGESTAESTLHDRISTNIARSFRGSIPGYSLGANAADVLIRQGSKVYVVEVKTGDPGLPLPSSTASQMFLLKRQALKKFPDAQEVLPIVITNYQVNQDDQKELEDQGIKVVRVDRSMPSSSDPGTFSRYVAKLTGLQADLI